MSYTFKLSRRLAAGHVWGAFVLLVLLGACESESPTDQSASGTSAVESLAAKPGKGSGRGRKTSSSLVRLVVSPDPASINPSSSVVFHASGVMNDGSSTSAVPVVWTATGGTIDSSGQYTAGPTAGNYWAIASDSSAGLADTSIVTVTPSPATVRAVALAPANTTVQVGKTVQFSASGVYADGSTAAVSVTYIATGGNVSSSGVFTAGTTQGTYRVIAQLVGDSLADTALVTVTAPLILTQLILSPSTISLQSGQTQQFTAAGRMSDGSTAPVSVSYVATGGTISSSGLYTAGNVGGSYHVNAQVQGASLADTSSVTVITSSTPNDSCRRHVPVSTVSQLATALGAAMAGDCIDATAGTYVLGSTLTIARSGTAADPIVVRGMGSSTVIDVNQRGMFLDASYLHLRRLRLTNFNTAGLWLRGVTGVVLDSVEVDHTLQEAVALKAGSNHNVIKNSLFHDTGIQTPQYGEAIYIGNSGDPGSPLDFEVTDNQILHNHFGPNVRAEAVDLKEGADRTIIRGNYIDGTGAVFSAGTKTLVAILANDVVVDSNFASRGAPMFVTFKNPTTRRLAGIVVSNNRIDLQDQFVSQRGSETPYGFQFQVGTVDPNGAIVKCNNLMITGLLSNRACTP